MKKNSNFLLLILLLLSLSIQAQQKSTKVYVARTGNAVQLSQRDVKQRRDEIIFQAKTKINNLKDLFNTITFEGTDEAQRNAVIQNSFLPGPNQVFYGDDVVVEDDIDPTHTSAENAVDLGVERYLRNMDLFYVKSDQSTIEFSQIIVSDVQEGKDFPFVKVYFTEKFNSKHTQIDSAYRPVHRVAELRAVLVNNKWRTFITRLAFLKAGEALSSLSKPVISKDFGPKKAVKSPEKIFQKVGNTIDSVSVKWDKEWLQVVRSSNTQLPIGSYQRDKTDGSSQGTISMILAKSENRLTFKGVDGSLVAFDRIEDPKETGRLIRKYKSRGWLQIAAGLVALGASYAGYSNLQDSYSNYTDKLSGLNAEYTIWQTLTQQPGGPPPTPMTFNSYARPGIYAVYGGGVAGGGLIINGIRQLLKAGKLKNRIRK